MPNFDAGTYFLTILAPVRPGVVHESDNHAPTSWDRKYTQALAKSGAGGVTSYVLGDVAKGSWAQRLRAVLATLPTALQSPATIAIGIQSPFARNTRNHLCRFALIENVIYNGRSASNPITNILQKIPKIGRLFGRYQDPLVLQHVDNLTTPYLLFAADIDAVMKDGESLPATLSEDEQDRVRDSYLEKLWDTANEEMQAVFENCIGFEKVKDAKSFAAYMEKCQVETTMPFHDYWAVDPPDLKKLTTSFAKKIALVIGLPVLLLLLLFLFAAGSWLFGSQTLLFLGWSSGTTAILALLLIGVSIAAAYYWIIRRGNKPLPPPKYSDLLSVLKALYLQQKFADFVIANQGASDADLHAAFGVFIGKHKPDESGPTQRPGYISSSQPGAVQP